MLDYKTVSLVMALITICLCLLLMIIPEFIFWLFGIEGGHSAAFIARRAGILFLGLSAMSYLGRKAAPSELRQAISLGMVILLASMAVLGLWEWGRGYAGHGILLAVATEACLAIAYGAVWRAGRGAGAVRSPS